MTKTQTTRAADASPGTKGGVAILSPADAAAAARPVMRLDQQETLVVLHLDLQNRLIGEPRVAAIGTMTRVDAHPRDVFREAIVANATSVVVLHNHPLGDPTPSRADYLVTEQLQIAGAALGIMVQDHVVVTADNHVSIRERGGGGSAYEFVPEEQP